MKTVIMAGGKGTRISSIAKDIPKPMIQIDGKPVLEHEIECLQKQGFRDIIITVSHLGTVIMNYFKDGSGKSPVTGKPFGVRITYYFEETPLGNAGALYKIKDQLRDDFLLINADALFDINFNRFVDYHKNCGGLATIFTHPNNHPYDSGIIVTNADHSVEKWMNKEDERPLYYQNRVNGGIHILSPKLLEKEPDSDKVDLDRHLLKTLEGTGSLFAYGSPEYLMDMGTPERYEKVCRDLQTGLVHKRNLRNKQKAIFLDRDGTINKYVGFLNCIDDFQLLPGAAEAIRKINDSGYLAIVITNQPVIARGEVTEQELLEIHNKMETLLGKEKAFLNGIYYCPHHPHRGYEGEITELKIECECRKPKPGMLYMAQEDFNLDLSQCWMVGDGKDDILAGQTAGCKAALIGTEDYGQDMTAKSLLDFVDKVVTGNV